MTTTLKGSFATRREAEMTVERLVQEYGVDRNAIVVAAEGPANSAGEDVAQTAQKSGAEEQEDAALNGRIAVMVDLSDESDAAEVRSAFAEFSAQAVAEK